MILILVRSARTQRSPSAQRINYSLRKSLLCMNSLRTLLDGSSIACLFAGGVNSQFGAWLFNRFVDRLLQRKNAIRSSSAMMIDNRKKTRGKSDSFIFFFYEINQLRMFDACFVAWISIPLNSRRAFTHSFLFNAKRRVEWNSQFMANEEKGAPRVRRETCTIWFVCFFIIWMLLKLWYKSTSGRFRSRKTSMRSCS